MNAEGEAAAWTTRSSSIRRQHHQRCNSFLQARDWRSGYGRSFRVLGSSSLEERSARSCVGRAQRCGDRAAWSHGVLIDPLSKGRHDAAFHGPGLGGRCPGTDGCCGQLPVVGKRPPSRSPSRLRRVRVDADSEEHRRSEGMDARAGNVVAGWAVAIAMRARCDCEPRRRTSMRMMAASTRNVIGGSPGDDGGGWTRRRQRLIRAGR